MPHLIFRGCTFVYRSVFHFRNYSKCICVSGSRKEKWLGLDHAKMSIGLNCEKEIINP